MRYTFVIALMLLAGIAAAHTVTMNFAINIGGGTNNTIHVNETNYSSHITNASTVFLFHLDNSTLDATQYGNNGTINGGANCSVTVTGQVNSACSFDGIAGFINVSYGRTLDFGTGSFSFGAWILRAGSSTPAEHVMGRYGAGSLPRWGVNITGGNIQAFLTDSNGISNDYSSGSIISNNTWYHVVVVVDRAGNISRIYVNGNQAATKNISSFTGNFSSSSGPAGIGGVNGSYFNGTIDEAFAYNTTLSAVDVSSIYSSGISEGTSLTFTNMNKKYISSSVTNTTAALVSAGTLLNARLNTSYNSTHYLMQMTQSSDNNRFLIAVFNGTYTDLETKLAMIDASRMASSAFGRYAVNIPSGFQIFIRLEYSGINIDSLAEWSNNGRLLIKNRGTTGRGLPNITIEVVK